MIDTAKLEHGKLYFIQWKYPVTGTAVGRYMAEDQLYFETEHYSIPVAIVTEVRGPIIYEQLPLVTTSKDTP